MPEQKARALCPCFSLFMAMLKIRRYRIEITADNIKLIHSQETPLCPVCGYLMQAVSELTDRYSLMLADGFKGR